MIRVLIADESVLIREGFKALMSDVADIEIVAEADSLSSASEMNELYRPDVIVADCYGLNFTVSDIVRLLRLNTAAHILSITQMIGKSEIKTILDAGVTSYLLKDCSKEEIIDAIHSSCKGERFLCGKIIEVLVAEQEIKITPAYVKTLTCQGVGVTDREMEIIKLIAEGLSNKQMADKLCLSTHTVNTHRKNIMGKLGVNNTAGVIMFAVKNQILNPEMMAYS